MCYEPYIGEIMMWGGNYAPEGWAFCNGQTLSIAQNQALYALIWNTYGGDGVSTFKLPDLRGRVPVGLGSGVGVTPRNWGEYGGSETATVIVDGAPQQITQGAEGQTTAVASPLAQQTATVNTMPPYQAVSFCIALQGIWPSRP